MSPRWPWSRREAVAYLALGSNVGDRLATLRAALDHLHGHDRIHVDRISGIYETVPVTGDEVAAAGIAVDLYLNLVAAVTTTMSPHDLLGTTQRIERALGRDRDHEVRWGPRTLDIDLLLYEHDEVDLPDLQVPHPRLTERAFVLVPLAEILPPGATLPDGTTVASHLARLAPINGIEPYVRLLEGPGAGDDPLLRRPVGPPGGPPRLGARFDTSPASLPSRSPSARPPDRGIERDGG